MLIQYAADSRRRVAGLYEALHNVNVVHGVVQERHLLGRNDQCNSLRLIDFGDALDYPPGDSDQVARSQAEEIECERTDVQSTFGIGPAIWTGVNGAFILRTIQARSQAAGGH